MSLKCRECGAPYPVKWRNMIICGSCIAKEKAVRKQKRDEFLTRVGGRPGSKLPIPFFPGESHAGSPD